MWLYHLDFESLFIELMAVFFFLGIYIHHSMVSIPFKKLAVNYNLFWFLLDRSMCHWTFRSCVHSNIYTHARTHACHKRLESFCINNILRISQTLVHYKVSYALYLCVMRLFSVVKVFKGNKYKLHSLHTNSNTDSGQWMVASGAVFGKCLLQQLKHYRML